MNLERKHRNCESYAGLPLFYSVALFQTDEEVQISISICLIMKKSGDCR